MRRSIFLAILFHIILHAPASANAAFCVPTPEVSLEQKPNVFFHSNNLMRDEGSVSISFGRRIYVSGRVLDSQCKPVADAVVRIWQRDSAGFNDGRDINFRYSGTSVTSNDGRYFFVTVAPGGSLRSLNVEVVKDGFPTLDSILIFPGCKNDFVNVRKVMTMLAEDRLILKTKSLKPMSYTFDLVFGGTA